MPTCWESTPEKCTGCHYCQTARDECVGVYPLSPLEAHRRDQADADLAGRANVGGALARIDAEYERNCRRYGIKAVTS